jgi:hypothetical protein
MSPLWKKLADRMNEETFPQVFDPFRPSDLTS